MDLSHINRTVGENMRWLRQYQANPDTAFDTNTNTGQSQDQQSQYMMLMFYQMMSMMFSQFFPQEGAQNTQEGATATQPDQASGQTVLPPGVTIQDGETENSNASETEPENKAMTMLSEALENNDDIASDEFTAELLEKLQSEEFGINDLGRSIKTLLLESDADNAAKVSPLLANLVQHKIINAIPFFQEQFLSDLPEGNRNSLIEAFVEIGPVTEENEVHRPFIALLLELLERSEQGSDTAQGVFLRELLAGYQQFLQDNPDAPQSDAIHHLLGLST